MYVCTYVPVLEYACNTLSAFARAGAAIVNHVVVVILVFVVALWYVPTVTVSHSKNPKPSLKSSAHVTAAIVLSRRAFVFVVLDSESCAGVRSAPPAPLTSAGFEELALLSTGDGTSWLCEESSRSQCGMRAATKAYLQVKPQAASAAHQHSTTVDWFACQGCTSFVRDVDVTPHLLVVVASQLSRTACPCVAHATNHACMYVCMSCVWSMILTCEQVSQ